LSKFIVAGWLVFAFIFWIACPQLIFFAPDKNTIFLY